MRLLFLGDIVGTPGVQLVRRAVPLLRARESLDLVVANAENASGGSGLYPSTLRQLKSAGVDAFTMGDHLYRKMDILPALEGEEPIVKPANFPTGSPGRGVRAAMIRHITVPAATAVTASATAITTTRGVGVPGHAWLLVLAAAVLVTVASAVPLAPGSNQPAGSFSSGQVSSTLVPPTQTVNVWDVAGRGALVVTAVLLLLFFYRRRLYILFWTSGWFLVSASMFLTGRQFDNPRAALLSSSRRSPTWTSTRSQAPASRCSRQARGSSQRSQTSRTRRITADTSFKDTSIAECSR